MKKLLFSLIVLLSSTMLFAQSKIIYQQDFESAVAGTELLGNVQVKNFNAGGGAAWTYDMATGAAAISGSKSSRLNIQNSGTDWWNLQYKVEDAALTTVTQGMRYNVTFKIKSSTSNNKFQFYVQGQSGFVKDITVTTANVTQVVSINTTPMDGSGVANFLWAFGKNPNVGDIWIDDIVITEIVFSEDFEDATVGSNNIGNIDANNYGGGAAWTFGLETSNPITDSKSGYFNITNTGVAAWTLQYRIDSRFAVKAGVRYKVTFKIKSSVANTIKFAAQGNANFEQNVNLVGGNTVENFSITTSPMDSSGANPNFFWLFGNPGVPAEIRIDDILITEVLATPVVTPIIGTYTYTGAAQGPNTATNTGTGTSYTYSYVNSGGTTYGPSGIAPINAGNYTVTATVYGSGNYYLASSSATAFTISPATPTATLVVSNSPVSYTNAARSAIVGIATSSVAGTVSNVLTDGAATQSASSTYPVTASFVPNDANYSTLTGLSAGNFVISSSTTWNGTVWNVGTPTVLLDAVINAAYTTGSFTAKSLTVNAPGSLTVATGTAVTVAEAIVNNGTITVENNANLIQTAAANTNSGSGTATVKRNSNALLRSDYTLWSSPVTGQNLLAFSPSTTTTRFYNYNTATNLYNAEATPGATPFTVGKGYLIRMPNTDLLTGYDAGSVTLVYPGQFTGTLNNGTIPVPITAGAFGLRYNLVGNPYPSPITMSTFVSENGDYIESTLYFWRKTNGVPNTTGSAYCTWNAGTFTTNSNALSADPLGVIQTGQGFFVEAKSGATSLSFNNTQRVINTANLFFRTKQVAEPSKIWLNATNAAGNFSQMAVTYFEGATLGVDAFDAKYINDSDYALTSDINQGEYTIQGRPAFDANDVVALNFKTAVAGDYAIAIDHTQGVFANGQDVYLVDSKTGTETDLKAGSYTFNATAGIDNARFSLKYQKTLKVDAPAFNENSVRVYKNNGTVYVNSGKIAINSIQVYDVQGRLIAERKNVKSSAATLENLKANNQVLLVKISGEDNSVVTKKVVN